VKPDVEDILMYTQNYTLLKIQGTDTLYDDGYFLGEIQKNDSGLFVIYLQTDIHEVVRKNGRVVCSKIEKEQDDLELLI
jgi:hypothetical protein